MTKEHDKKRIYEVRPLRTQDEIDRMRKALRWSGRDAMTTNKTGQRNLMLFNFGCATGLRVSDIVKLKIKDIATDHPEIRETKTGKTSKVLINRYLRHDLNQYIAFMRRQGEPMRPDDYLFQSHKGGALSTTQVYRILTKAGKDAGLRGTTCHCMRKTFAYQYWKHGGRIETLQRILNHASPAITMHYIGIDQNIIDDSMKDFHF